MTENPPAPSEGLAVYAVNAYRSAQATSGTASEANDSPFYRELLSEARQLAAERASVSQDSFVSNPAVVGENRQGGQIWSSGSETFPVAFRRLEETDLSRMPFVNYAMATGSGRLSEAPPRSWSSDVVNIFRNPYRGPIDKFRDFVRTTGAYALDNAEEFDRQFGKVPGSNVQVVLGFGTVTRSANMLRMLGSTGGKSVQAEVEALRRMGQNARLSPGSTDRFVQLQEKAEANALRRLQEMEAANPGAHYLEKHGAQLDLQSQFDRAAYGLNPTTGASQGIPSAATRFLSHRDQLNVITRAENIYQLTGDRILASNPMLFQSAIGSGFERGTLNYGVQYSGRAFINPRTGRANTAFPVWGQ